MAALLLGTIGGTAARGDSLGARVRFDLQARSREFLRRGLILSGAIHITLLFAFLNLAGSGGDVLVRTNGRPIDVFRQPPVPPLISYPPSGTTPAVDAAGKTGRVVPVEDRVVLPKVQFTGIGPADTPPPGGPQSSDPASGPGPGGPSNGPDPERVYMVADVEQAPVPIESPKPLYPEYARDNGISGRVVTQVLVRADGSVGRVTVKSGIKILGDAAQEGLYRWRFRPARMGGRPVAVWVEIPINFTL
jgi:protein TonB